MVHFFGDPQVFFQILEMNEEIHFSLKSDFIVDVRFELTTNDPVDYRLRDLLRQAGWTLSSDRLADRSAY